MIDYFFAGNEYIRVTRTDVGPGSVDAGYPAPISNWGWGSFGAHGIDAALYSGTECYFFAGNEYIRVTRGLSGPGSVDAGYPKPISGWGWGAFGANGIDAALNSGAVDYFFAGTEYIRVTRGQTGPGSVDAGYPKPISGWGWGAFGANGIDGALYSGSKCYFFAGNEYIRVSRSDQGPGIVDAGYPKPISNWGWGAFGANGISAALYSGGPLATPPSGGLGSNSNYLLANCSNITGLSATINIDVDIMSTNGFGFQLNAYSAKGDNDAAQQYIIFLDGTVLRAWAESWLAGGTVFVFNQKVNLVTLPSTTLPAGYELGITLHNDAGGKITSASFAVFDKTGKDVGSTTIDLIGLENVAKQAATEAELAPITAFQLNLVGPGDSARANLTSGAGTITYTAGVEMTPGATEPPCIDWSYSTEETANSVYGELPSTSSVTFTQSFQAAT